MKRRTKKIIIALLKIIVLIVLLYIIFNKDEFKSEQIPLNTYINNTTGALEKYRMANVKRFIKYIEDLKYEEAYSFLSDKCKEEKFYNNIEAFKEFVNTYLIAENKPKKTIFYEVIVQNTASTNIKVTFSVKDIYLYKEEVRNEATSKYYDSNILDIVIEEKSLNDYKYYIDLNIGYK